MCEVSDIEDWLHGSFNVCVPITMNNRQNKRVLLRFPLPYRVGEAFNPGNSDEKIRCEAGTYAWLQENCPEIPIPQLYAFSLSTGEVGVDEIVPQEYDPVRRQFMEALVTEEELTRRKNDAAFTPFRLSEVLNHTWESGAFWYTLGISSPSGLFTIFTDHIKPLFCNKHDEESYVVMPFFFEKNVGDIAGRKLADKEIYDKDLLYAFEHGTDYLSN
ncbi:hypothetical protein PDE_02529 [Penicillium oxalicum 114-2]|uniref:Aminoglycoside phosphotransferase domain-containing protein n=1 Tax=Penicillium oxalicum (strain 114-2 / CGMCC 5302) TaxID=933388 RepID=S7ZG05_PENO1|nr:hypothetical protein PDE_02529 [Penicillium oxalicum 114-2]